MRRTWWVVWGLMCVVGCASIEVAPTGAPVALPSGPPDGPCENKAWLELRPSRAAARHPQAYPFFYLLPVWLEPPLVRDGLGVYPWGEEVPLYVGDILPALGAPGLERVHMKRVRLIEEQQAFSNGMILAGLGAALAGGLAAAATARWQPGATTDGVRTVSLVLLGSGAVSFVLGAMLAPDGQEMARMYQRRYVFFEREDDLEALRRGVERHNESVRERCQ